MKQEIIVQLDICKTITNKRKELGLSQQQMSDLLHIKRGKYAYIESGNSSVRLVILMNIFSILGIRMYLD